MRLSRCPMRFDQTWDLTRIYQREVRKARAGLGGGTEINQLLGSSKPPAASPGLCPMGASGTITLP